MDPRGLLSRAARAHPRRLAVACGAARLTYPELGRAAARVRRALLAAGARRGDRIAAFFPNCHHYLAAYFAALDGGYVLVPMNLRLGAREVDAILDHSGARLALGTPDRLQAIGLAARRDAAGWALAPARTRGGRRAERRAAMPPGAAHLYYTSGTTGRPKGVVLTRGNVGAHISMTLDELRFGARDVWLHAAPMFHLADAWAVFTATAAGATHVLLPAWDPEMALRLLIDRGVTLTNLVPAMIPGLLDAAAASARRPALRLLLSGGAPIAPALVRRIETVLGCAYAQTYGLTETSPFLTFSLPRRGESRDPDPGEALRRRARTGRAVRGVTLRVVRPPGSARFVDVPPDDVAVGEVIVRGPTVTPGYWRDRAATARAFRGGWFHTGDLGTLDARGSVNLVDRAKDVIVTGGESVYCIEVESVLLEHPGVREAAVFGVPDDVWGEAVRAAVVPVAAGAVAAADLAAFCRERIAAFKCPRAVDLAAALPRTATGKIDKKALREPFWAGRDRRIH